MLIALCYQSIALIKGNNNLSFYVDSRFGMALISQQRPLNFEILSIN